MIEYTAYVRLTDVPNSCEIEIGRELVHVEIPSDTPEDGVEDAIKEVLDCRGFGAESYQILAYELGYFDDLEDFWTDITEEENEYVAEINEEQDDERWAEYLAENYDLEADSVEDALSKQQDI